MPALRDEAKAFLTLSEELNDSQVVHAFLLHSIAASLLRIGDLLEAAQDTHEAERETAFTHALYAPSKEG